MKKKWISYLLIFLLSFSFVFQIVGADSGWDVDYDSGSSGGSSWHSSSSGSSGSSWDSGSGWSTDGSDSSIFLVLESKYFPVVVIVGGLLISIIVYCLTSSSSPSSSSPRYWEMSEEQIHTIDPDMNVEEFKNNVYDIFVQVQNAWTNFDFDTLRSLLTDELYNMYESELQILKAKKQKNIMDHFSLGNVQIMDMFKKDDTISVQVRLQVRFYDYVIEEETNKVVRGDKESRVIVTYSLTFVKRVEDKVTKCPNCGAKIEENTDTCPYCHTKFEKLSTKYILSKKTNLSQSKE